MRFAKHGEWYKLNVQRALANNSVNYKERPDVGTYMREWLSLYDSKSGERGVYNGVSAKNQVALLNEREKDGNGGYVKRREPRDDFGTNPCSEIILRSREFCNLSECVVRRHDDVESLKKKVRSATILGTFQSTLTNFRYLTKEWENNCTEERLLGVSLTGILDNPLTNGKKKGLEPLLEELRKVAYETNKEWVERAGNPMDSGYEIIFQMPFIYDGVRGIADFLEKTENNGKVVYEPVDSKLARSGAKQGHLLQLLFYTEAVEDLTGERPEKIHVELGSGERESFLVSDYWWYWQRLRKKLIQAVETDSSTDTKPEKCSHCGICEFYWEECRPEWRANDSLVFLSGVRKTHQEALNEVGIETLTGLAAIPESHLSEISEENFDEESEQAFQTAIDIWAKKSGNNLDDIHSEWKANQKKLPVTMAFCMLIFF